MQSSKSSTGVGHCMWMTSDNVRHNFEIKGALLQTVYKMESKKALIIAVFGMMLQIYCVRCKYILLHITPESKVHGANMGPIWDR